MEHDCTHRQSNFSPQYEIRHPAVEVIQRMESRTRRGETILNYKAIWVRPEVFKLLDKECKYQGTTKGRFTEHLITEGVQKNIYNDPCRINPEYNNDVD